MASSTLSAHAAFFVEGAPAPDFGTLLDRGPLLAIGGGVLLGLLAWIVASTCADPRRERCLLRWVSELVSGSLAALTEHVPPIARMALGGTLVWCAVIGAVGTPNLLVEDASGAALRSLAAGIGIMLVLGIRVRTLASASIVLMLLASMQAGTPLVFLERLDLAGLAVFVAIVGGRRLEPRIDAATMRSLALGSRWLRVLVAFGLVTVAITEKLANVPITARVLAEHPNVDIGVVLGTSAETTVLLLGAAEITFAVLVLLLPLPELVALAIGAPFVLSVGEFGMLEVPGHLPVWGAVGVLALLGAHPQTSDMVRPPWLRGRMRTPDAARVRTPGERVHWATSTTGARQIVVGGSITTPVPARLVATAPAAATLPAAPPMAPQVAAWLAAPAAPVAPSAPAQGMDSDLPRFQWAAAPGAGVAAR